MKLPWLSGRRKWGAASAGMLASLLLAFSGQRIGGNCRHQTQPGLGPRTRRTQPGLGHGRDLRLLPHAARRPTPALPRRCGTSGSVPTAPRPAAVRTPRTTRCRRRRWTARWRRWARSRWPACRAMTARRRWTTSSTRRARAATTPTGGGNDGRTYTWTGSTVNAAGRLSSGVALLGTDLSNDHPIGIQYCGGGLSGSGTTVSGTCKDTDFNAPETQVINNNQVFWIDTGGPGKQRTDLPLYLRTGASSSLGPWSSAPAATTRTSPLGQAGPPARRRPRARPSCASRTPPAPSARPAM
jgi:hypothetical protein